MNEINELDRARAEEALKLIDWKPFDVFDVAVHAAMLARTGWEPVDEDLIAAREIVAQANKQEGVDGWAEDVRIGLRDHHIEVQVALAAIKRGRELERASRERGQ